MAAELVDGPALQVQKVGWDFDCRPRLVDGGKGQAGRQGDGVAIERGGAAGLLQGGAGQVAGGDVVGVPFVLAGNVELVRVNLPDDCGKGLGCGGGMVGKGTVLKVEEADVGGVAGVATEDADGPASFGLAHGRGLRRRGVLLDFPRAVTEQVGPVGQHDYYRPPAFAQSAGDGSAATQGLVIGVRRYDHYGLL